MKREQGPTTPPGAGGVPEGEQQGSLHAGRAAESGNLTEVDSRDGREKDPAKRAELRRLAALWERLLNSHPDEGEAERWRHRVLEDLPATVPDPVDASVVMRLLTIAASRRAALTRAQAKRKEAEAAWFREPPTAEPTFKLLRFPTAGGGYVTLCVESLERVHWLTAEDEANLHGLDRAIKNAQRRLRPSVLALAHYVARVEPRVTLGASEWTLRRLFERLP